ncbi:hypothetical protein DET57_12717 [Klebsiella oxytoca]|uniref:Uncharacterized protein n=1 Tax=Klebsiella oxytoca TaxID=571 RepID=A0A318FBG3_KLEOX|nr:hypothetical protein DET57_12717 [Klebsiella oxytoca]
MVKHAPAHKEAAATEILFYCHFYLISRHIPFSFLAIIFQNKIFIFHFAIKLTLLNLSK